MSLSTNEKNQIILECAQTLEQWICAKINKQNVVYEYGVETKLDDLIERLFFKTFNAAYEIDKNLIMSPDVLKYILNNGKI